MSLRKFSVRLGNNKEMEVCGVGTVTIGTRDGELKQLHGVQLDGGLLKTYLALGSFSQGVTR